MRRNDVVFPPPAFPQSASPLPEAASTSHGGGASPQSADDGLNPSIVITVLVLATAVIVSASIYLFLRCISLYFRRRRSSSVDSGAVSSDFSRQYHHNHVHGSARRVAPENVAMIESLPLFTFASMNGSNAASGGDCAVCLSKFEPLDQLRLLPACCHAFHADCIDAWLATNQTCPLCRSSIFVSESEVMNKILSTAAPNSASRSGSFRVEIGSVSRHHLPSETGSDRHRRSYSIGSFDYIIDDVQSEVTVASTRRRSDLASGGDKSQRIDESEISAVAPPGEILAAEVAGGRSSWLKDYVDRMSTWTASRSLSSSFRSSGRFFVGSSRRTDASRIHDPDLEAIRLGDEIGEMFRWLSGV